MHPTMSGSVVLACVSALLTAGCAANTAEIAAGDPGTVYEAIAHSRETQALDALEPRRLADALPNREVVFASDLKEVRERWSDLVAVGTVTSVSPDEGVYYPNAHPTYTGDDEEAAEIVEFDNPDAHERSIVVTVEPEWTSGDDVEGVVEFRIGVPVDATPSEFLSGLMGMREVVVLLNEFGSGRHRGEYYPILNGAALGAVVDGNRLDFKGLGSQETAFVGTVDTVEELRAEAAKPMKTVKGH